MPRRYYIESALLNRASMTLNATMPMMPTVDSKMSSAALLKKVRSENTHARP